MALDPTIWHDRVKTIVGLKMPSLKDNIVCITGASSGIGEACAIACAIQGAHLILIARRLEKLEALSCTLTHQYAVRVQIMPLDICDAKAVEKSFFDFATGMAKN